MAAYYRLTYETPDGVQHSRLSLGHNPDHALDNMERIAVTDGLESYRMLSVREIPTEEAAAEIKANPLV